MRNIIQAEKVFDRSMDALGLSVDLKTDPKIIGDILKEMRLDDFRTSFLPMKIFLEEIISKPQSLGDMLESIKQGVVNKHPAVVEFAELAIQKNWFGKSEHINKSVQVAFILEHVTVAMCNSHIFFIEVYNHLRSKERLLGLDSRHTFSACKKILTTTHNLFDTIKLMSVDPFMVFFRVGRGLGRSEFNKEELNILYKKGDLSYLEYKLLSPVIKKGGLNHALELLRINIYEAGITEYRKGFKTNSVCAFELNEVIRKNPPCLEFHRASIFPENTTQEFYKSLASKDNLFPIFSFSQNWVSLYISWNMSFLVGNFEDLDILFPKLLIPSIINAKNEHAGGVIISLWLAINYFFFRRYDRIKPIHGPNNKAEISEAWAIINKKYAFELAERETHENSNKLMQHYNRIFSQPIYHLLKLFLALIR